MFGRVLLKVGIFVYCIYCISKTTCYCCYINFIFDNYRREILSQTTHVHVNNNFEVKMALGHLYQLQSYRLISLSINFQMANNSNIPYILLNKKNIIAINRIHLFIVCLENIQYSKINIIESFYLIG